MRKLSIIALVLFGLLALTASATAAQPRAHQAASSACKRRNHAHRARHCSVRRHRKAQPKAKVAAAPSNGMMLNGTFGGGLSKYSAVNGHCFSSLGPQEEKFTITSSCDPSGDGLYRSDINSRNIYRAGVPECTTIPVRFPGHVAGVTDNTWLVFAETEDPYDTNQDDLAGWGMTLTSYYNGNQASDPNQFAISFADYAHSAPAWTSSSNVDTAWHTLSVCTNDANNSSGEVYGIWFDGVRQTFNHGPDAGSQTLSGFPIIQNDPSNSSNWPLIIDDYTGGSPQNELIHGAPLVAKMAAGGLPPQPAAGWNGD
jgi:hypothetical protein